VRRLKILIHGQEVETLAGHLDLSQTFLVNTNVAPGPRADAAPAAMPALTPASTNVKLAAPVKNP